MRNRLRILFRRVSWVLLVFASSIPLSAYSGPSLHKHKTSDVHWFRTWVSGAALSALKGQSKVHFIENSDLFYQWLDESQTFPEMLHEAGLREFETSLGYFYKSVAITVGEKLGIPESAVSLGFDQVTHSKILKFSDPRRTQILKSLPDRFWNELDQLIIMKISEFKIQDAPALKELLNPESGFSLQEPMRSTVDAILVNYFNELPIENRVRMISNILALSKFAEPSEQLSVVLFETGPTLQKLFQLIADQANADPIKVALKKLRDQIPPVEGTWVKERLKNRLGNSRYSDFLNIEEMALASGTIGQVHRATLKNGENVIIKLRRPGVVEMMEKEFELLYRIVAPYPVAHEVINRLENTLREEVDFRIEADHLKKGEIYRTKRGEIDIAKKHSNFAAYEDLLILEQAKGVPFHRSVVSDVQLKIKRLKNLMQIWFREAVFGSGFFHGDLHGGNLFFDANQNGKITIIDFGNSGRLSIAERRGLVRMMIAAMIGDSDEMFMALNQFSPIPQSESERVRLKIVEIFQNFSSMEDRLSKTLPEAIRLGVDIPKSIVSFFRAKEFLELQYSDLVGPNQSMKVFLGVAAHEVGKSLPQQLFSKQIRKGSPFTWRELGFLTRFGIAEMIRRIGDCSRYLLPVSVK